MSGIFNDIKKKYLTAAIVIGAVGGICFGLLLVGIVLLSLKLSEIDLNFGYYFLIGFGTAVLFGVALFLILRPTDRKIAKKLDREYDLHEKVQTMVAYREREGEVISVQREDASNRLASLPKKKPTAVHILKLAALPVIAFVIFFSAVFIPTASPEPVEGNTTAKWQIAAVSLLIDDVNKSDLNDTYKTTTVGILQNVKDGITEEKTDAELRDAAFAAIKEIDDVFAADSYAALAAALHGYESTEQFALAIENSVESYRLSNPITTYEQVKSRAQDLEELVGDTLDGYGEEILKEMTNEDAVLAESLDELTSAIGGALENSGVVQSDALYSSLKDFRDALSSIEGDETDAARLLEESLDTFFAALTKQSLLEQTYNRMMREFVRERLAEIFGIDSAELPGNSNGNSGGEIVDNPGEGEGNGGGYGRGEILYGSESVIYDPYEDEFVIYGEVINDYYAMMLEQLTNGTLSEEEESLISDYFSMLYSGIEDAE